MSNKLNPGIAKTVHWLNEHGFITTDSGDGQTHDFACDLPIPYVHMVVHPYELAAQCDRLKLILEREGIAFKGQNETGTAPEIVGTYDPASGVGVVSVFNVAL